MSKVERKCNKCHIVKQLDMFHRDSSRPLGRGYTCKNCRNKHWLAVEYPRLKTREDYHQKHRLDVSKWIKDNPEKAKAHRLARKILLPELCEYCGVKPAKHRHHSDYSKPLDVVGLCVPCHEKAHHGVIA